MKTELCPDYVADLARFQGERLLLEGGNHLPAAEPPQVAALEAGGILGKLLGESSEIRSLRSLVPDEGGPLPQFLLPFRR